MENKELIEERVKNGIQQIRTYLQQDGGDIEYVDLTNAGVVMVRLKGACNGCPHANATIKEFVQRTLKEAIPEVKCVEAVR